MELSPAIVTALLADGSSPTDANVAELLKKLKHYNTLDYLYTKTKKNPRKPTEYDYLLQSYPYHHKELHEDHFDSGDHHDIDPPHLDPILLTDETTENVFRKNKDASEIAVERCVSDAFFAGNIQGLILNIYIYVCHIYLSYIC